MKKVKTTLKQNKDSNEFVVGGADVLNTDKNYADENDIKIDSKNMLNLANDDLKKTLKSNLLGMSGKLGSQLTMSV
jgi:hypothetical protein